MPSSERFVPKDYQLRAMEFMVTRPAAGLLLRPGLGKTACVLHAFQALRRRGLVRRVLVVGTRRIIYNVWPQEIAKWGLPFRCVTLHGARKAEALREDADVYLINYEGLPWLAGVALKRDREKLDVLVLDESTKVKSWSAQRTKALRTMLNQFKRRYILTGTPVPNSLMDLFAQVYMLDQGETLGRYITQYRLKYFHPAGYKGYDWELNPGAEKQIFEALKPLLLRLETDALKLPPLTTNHIHIELPADARRAYADLEEQFVADWNAGLITAENAAARTLKLRQWANGTTYDDVGAPVVVHDERLEALEELLEELSGEPALVAYSFNHDLARLKKRFNAPHIGGGVGDREGTRLCAEFNAGRLPVLFAHPASVSHGLNLQAAGRTVIFYSLDWNLEEHEQFIARVWRQGVKGAVTVHYLVARNTVDELILKALGAKDALQKRALKALEERYGKPQAVKRRA